MSTKAKTQTAVQLAPRVNLCDNNPYVFLLEIERLILAGYRLNLNEQFDLLPGCYIATMVLPDQDTASV